MSDKDTIRVVVADSREIVRKGLAAVFMAHNRLQLIGEAVDGAEVIQLCEMVRPDVVVMQAWAATVDENKAARLIRQHCPQVHIFLLIETPQTGAVPNQPGEGISGYLNLGQSAQGVIDTILKTLQQPQPPPPDASLILRAEHLGKLEVAMRTDAPKMEAILQALTRHIPLIFPQCQMQVRLFPGQELFNHPAQPHPSLSEPAWKWLRTQDKTSSYSPGEGYPWGGEQPAGSSLILAPVPAAGGGSPAGGIGLVRRGIPEDLDEMLPIVQSIAFLLASAIKKVQEQEGKLFQQHAAQELQMAGRIQAGILPEKPPSIRGWDLAARLIPARETSGDFYDFIPLVNGNWGIVIADVTDKGLGAAVFMALSSTLLRTYAVQYQTLPAFAMASVNERILSDTRGSMFVTAFYGVLEPETGRLRYVNAGHNPPFLHSPQKGKPVDRLFRTGMALGILKEASWTQKIVKLIPGDVMVLYTDGITEAHNRAGEAFGERRLMEVIRTMAGRPAKDIQEAVLAEVNRFIGDVPYQDDVTLMVLARKG